MKKNFCVAICFSFLLAFAGVSHAQEQTSWVVIKQVDDSRSAKGHARLWALQIDGVHALRDALGRYAVAVGPFEYGEAQSLIQQFVATGQIPEDSQLAASADFTEVIWPPSASRILKTEPSREQQRSPIDENLVEVRVIDAPSTIDVVETLDQTKEREAALPSEIKYEIQFALRWFGHYSGQVDGEFGTGTRNAISAFQNFLGESETGYLSTIQQSKLLTEYQEEVRSIGFYDYSDYNAGVTMAIPGTLVEFSRYSPPFAIFESADGRNIKILVISLEGGSRNLRHLFDVVQMFDAVPKNADKSINNNFFQIAGQDEKSGAFAFSQLSNGQVKGFLATWPAGENKIMDRVVPFIRDSFQTSNDNTLDDLAKDGFVSDSVDMLAGLESRKPDAAASGFYFDAFGHVMTVRSTVEDCSRIHIGSGHDMILDESGSDSIAILSPISELSPIQFAKFSLRNPEYGESVSVSGFSFGGRLGAPTLTSGNIRNAGGLDESAQIGSVSINALRGDAGGPIIDSSGAVLGMLLPSEIDGRKLPVGEAFFVGSNALESLAAAAERKIVVEQSTFELNTSTIERIARDITVLVQCFK